MRSKAALIPKLAAVARSRWEYGNAGDVLNGERTGRIHGRRRKGIRAGLHARDEQWPQW
jgi:hypothetical protein